MQGYAIVKLEADAAAVQESIVQHFNEYMQQAHKNKTQSFVHDGEGYFRLEYADAGRISSAPIEAFGNFLLQSGYTVNGISTATTSEGQEGTEVSFSKGGKEAHVLLSTLNVY